MNVRPSTLRSIIDGNFMKSLRIFLVFKCKRSVYSTSFSASQKHTNTPTPNPMRFVCLVEGKLKGSRKRTGAISSYGIMNTI